MDRYTSLGVLVASSYLDPKKIVYGDNGNIDVFVGSQVQLAESADIAAVKSSLDNSIPLLAKEASLTAINTNAADAKTAALDAKKAASLAAALSA